MSGLARFTRAEPERTADGRGVDAPAADAPLRRFLQPRQRPTPGEACELCGAPIADDHRHVVDLDQRGILCACRPCGLLFTRGGDAHEHFRTVPDRYRRVDPFDLTPTQWAALQIPVGIAFVVRNSQLGQTVAFYPSPGGATESELHLAAWDDVVAANPALGDVEDDVEAVLVRREPGGVAECFVVPVDRCYELVGTLRLRWHGFDGGAEVRAAIGDFFDEVRERARPAARSRA